MIHENFVATISESLNPCLQCMYDFSVFVGFFSLILYQLIAASSRIERGYGKNTEGHHVEYPFQ
jgi:hypothetical protein